MTLSQFKGQVTFVFHLNNSLNTDTDSVKGEFYLSSRDGVVYLQIMEYDNLYRTLGRNRVKLSRNPAAICAPSPIHYITIYFLNQYEKFLEVESIFLEAFPYKSVLL